MPYCNDSSKSKISIYSANQLVEIVEFDFGGFDVSSGSFTDIFYGANWIPVPGNTSFSDLRVSGTITEIGPRTNNGNDSRTVLSNGWTPNFYGINSVNISFRYYCLITITKNNQILYEKEFPCLIRFDVACGNDCPEGHIKCKSDNYPGYCCIPCSSIASEVKSIRSLIASMKS